MAWRVCAYNFVLNSECKRGANTRQMCSMCSALLKTCLHKHVLGSKCAVLSAFARQLFQVSNYVLTYDHARQNLGITQCTDENRPERSQCMHTGRED